jgi:predicted transcriptional regulator
MPQHDLPKPTEAELSILRVLWKRGPSTVRDVHEALGEATGYTTVLKFLQIMTEKKLVKRDERARSHVYSANAPQETTQKQLLKDLLDRVFSGSPAKLVMQALSTKKVSSQELEEIKAMIKKLEKE